MLQSLGERADQVACIAAIYFIGFEASRWQATPGKRLLGLRVETVEGARLSVGRALLRLARVGNKLVDIKQSRKLAVAS